MFNMKTDVFPKDVSCNVEKLVDYPNFGKIMAEDIVRHFCLYMENDKIYFQRRYFSEHVRNTFVKHGKEARQFRDFKPNGIVWSKVVNRFKRVADESNRVNSDTRTGFKIKNDYLVKSYFTFGQRTVSQEHAHLIQILEVPLLFFLRSPEKKNRKTSKDGFFPHTMLDVFDRRVLQPNACYRIPPGTTYFLFSLQKNFFRLDIVRKDYVVPFSFTDPVQTRVTEGLYDVPVETPYIEDLEKEEPEPFVKISDVDDFNNFTTDNVIDNFSTIGFEDLCQFFTSLNENSETTHSEPEKIVSSQILFEKSAVNLDGFAERFREIMCKRTTDPKKFPPIMTIVDDEQPLDLSIKKRSIDEKQQDKKKRDELLSREEKILSPPLQIYDEKNLEQQFGLIDSNCLNDAIAMLNGDLSLQEFYSQDFI